MFLKLGISVIEIAYDHFNKKKIVIYFFLKGENSNI